MKIIDNLRNWLAKGTNSDSIVNSNEVAKFVEAYKMLFINYRKNLYDLHTNESFLINKSLVWEEMMLHESVAIAYAHKTWNGRPFLADEAFLASCLKMNEEMKEALTTSEFNDFKKKATKLSKEIVELMAMVRTGIEIPDPKRKFDPGKFDDESNSDVSINALPNPDSEKKKSNGKKKSHIENDHHDSSEEILEDNSSNSDAELVIMSDEELDSLFKDTKELTPIVKKLMNVGYDDENIIKIIKTHRGTRSINTKRLEQIQAKIVV